MEDLFDKLEELSGENTIPINDLFDSGFMKQYTQFETIEEFFEESQWEVENEEDLEMVDENSLDKYVRDTTKFKSWQHMLEVAAKGWLEGELGG